MKISNYRLGYGLYVAAILVNCYVMAYLDCGPMSALSWIDFIAIVVAFEAGQLVATHDPSPPD